VLACVEPFFFAGVIVSNIIECGYGGNVADTNLRFASGYGLSNGTGTVTFVLGTSGFTYTGSLDLAVTATAADQAINADLSMNSATAIGVGVDATAVQLTTARTAGYLAGVRSATTSLAGDLNSVKYYDYLAGAPTDGGGTVLHVAYGILGTGHDILIDCSSAANGENDVLLPDNVASAFEFREGANTYMTFVTTNSGESVNIIKPLKVDGIRSFSGTTGTLLVNMTDNLADGFSVQEASTKYMTFVTTDGSEVVNVFKPTVTVGLVPTTSGATAITTTRAVTRADSGGIFTVAQSSAYTITVATPVAAGERYVFQCVSPGAFDVSLVATGCTFEGTITIDASTIPATGSTLKFASGAAVLGDNIELIATSTSKFFVRAISSGAGGITIT
jgi:hypothetical protein